jgi:hypothetical protein
MAEWKKRLLTRAEAARVARGIAPSFPAVVNRFDGSKYPDDVYQRLLEEFAPESLATPRRSIPDALCWKYGYWRKVNFPLRQKLMMQRVASKWPRHSRLITPEETFVRLNSQLKIRYISAAFLTHLLYPTQIPIIDQHNFRAMNGLMRRKAGREPTRYEHLVELKQFIREVLEAWPKGSTERPGERELDKYLMVYGKSLKVRRKRRTQPTSSNKTRVSQPKTGKSSVTAGLSPKAISKLQRARSIYARMRGKSSAAIRGTFVVEAGLTEKGANTYYYRFRREDRGAA